MSLKGGVNPTTHEPVGGVRDHRRMMIVTLQTQRVQTLEQVRAFVEGSEAVDFAGSDRAGVYTLVRRTLVKLDYHRLGKADKGLVKRYRMQGGSK